MPDENFYAAAPHSKRLALKQPSLGADAGGGMRIEGRPDRKGCGAENMRRLDQLAGAPSLLSHAEQCRAEMNKTESQD